MKIVQKYGGSSLADGDCLRRVAQRIQCDAENNQMLVVVSAQGKTTDALTRKYGELSENFPSRESDALLVTGEQASAALLAATLCFMGSKAVSLNGLQVPVCVSGNYGDGRIYRIDTSRIYREWKDGNIVVVTGFQGVTDRGDFITLGRGGSDTSAVAFAAALRADRCMIFTDVDGVYSTDPRKEPMAVRFDSIHPDTMLDLASSGAKVLHPRAAALVKQYQIPTEILTSFSRHQGTMIVPSAPRRTGITVWNREDGSSVISVVSDGNLPGSVLKKTVESFEKDSIEFNYIHGIFRVITTSEKTENVMKRLHSILYSA